MDTAAAAVVPYDASPAVAPTLEALTARRTSLDTVVGVDAAQTAAIEAEKAALDEAIAAANTLATAQQTAADAEAAAALEAVGTDDVALAAALEAAANKNRLEQYGADYINDEVMGWAKDVLDEKIDAVKETIAAETVEPAPVEPEPLESEPLEPAPLPLEPAT